MKIKLKKVDWEEAGRYRYEALHMIGIPTSLFIVIAPLICFIFRVLPLFVVRARGASLMLLPIIYYFLPKKDDG